MDYEVFVLFVACVSVVVSNTAPTHTPVTQGYGEETERSSNDTISNDSPSRNVTNLNPDEFYQWLIGIGKTEAQGVDTTSGSTVTTTSASAPTPVVSDGPENSPEQTPDTTGSTISNDSPSRNVTNLNPDEFYQWLIGVGKTEAQGVDTNSGSTVTTTSASAPTPVVSDGPETLPEQTPDTTESIGNVPEGLSVTVSELDALFRKLDKNQHIITDSRPKTTPETHIMAPEPTEVPDITENDGTRLQHKFNLPPPDKFYEWFSSRNPEAQPKEMVRDQSETRTKVASDESLTSKVLIVSVSAACGVLLVLAVILSAYVVLMRQRSKDAKSLENPTASANKGCFNTGYTDVFHGIPTNNDIWKNLDLLSVNTPSVLPDSSPKF